MGKAVITMIQLEGESSSDCKGDVGIPVIVTMGDKEMQIVGLLRGGRWP